MTEENKDLILTIEILLIYLHFIFRGFITRGFFHVKMIVKFST
jgi:hypothetical protein